METSAEINATRNNESSIAPDIERQLQEKHLELQITKQKLQLLEEHFEEYVKFKVKNLITARNKAEHDNKTKSAFLAKMSHELRTSLSVILGYSELLLDDAKGGANEIEGDLRSIHGAGHHLLDIINDILDLSKIESGKMHLNNNTLNIPNFLQDLEYSIQPLVEKNNNTFNVHILGNIKQLEVDPTRLRQILTNLLHNACKFTNDGQITLTAANTKKNKIEWVVFSITDTGIGLSDSQMQKIFDEYEQISNSLTERGIGTGLGLSICRQMLNLMGGEISVKSVLGKGTSFTVYLPVKSVKGKRSISDEVLLY